MTPRPPTPSSPEPAPVAPPPATTLPARSVAAWWRGLAPWGRWALAAGVAVLCLDVALAGLSAVTGGSGPGGPRSSSYATSDAGLAAFAQLLADNGHPVRRLRTDVDRADLDHGATLVVADAPEVSPAEVEAVVRFVEAGGRLVTAGDGAAVLAGALTGDGPRPSGEPASPARPVVPVPEVAGVESVEADGPGAFDADDAGSTLPVLAGRRATLATVANVGRGRVVAVADATPWHNRLLARADKASFALSVVGEAGRPVAFAEAHHGYGRGKGLAAVPGPWRWALGMGLVAALAAMWSKGRRLGPPEVLDRALPPPRQAYVDAVAATLARTDQPAEVMAPLQAAARRRLARRTGLPADAGVEDVRRAGARVGLAEDEVAALMSPAATDHQVMAAARALARLEGAER